jgi:hypothetical protein
VHFDKCLYYPSLHNSVLLVFTIRIEFICVDLGLWSIINVYLPPWDCFFLTKKFLLPDQALSGSVMPDIAASGIVGPDSS